MRYLVDKHTTGLGGTTMGIRNKRCRSNKATKILVAGARGYYCHSCHLNHNCCPEMEDDPLFQLVAHSSLGQTELGEVQETLCSRWTGSAVGLSDTAGNPDRRMILYAQGPRR